jgi:hypothetical protein
MFWSTIPSRKHICGSQKGLKLNVNSTSEQHTAKSWSMKSPIFWDMTPCSPSEVNQRFGGTCRLHLQSRRISQRENRCQAELWFCIFRFLARFTCPAHCNYLHLTVLWHIRSPQLLSFICSRNSFRSIYFSCGIIIPLDLGLEFL